MSGRTTALYRYSIPTLLQSIAVDSVIPFLTLYLVQSMQYSAERAASLVGLAIGITTAMRFVVGRVIDQLDKRTAGRVGLVLLFALPVALLTKCSYEVIVLAVVLSMIGDLLFSNSTVNLIYRELDEAQAKLAVSHFYAAANAATFIAPLLTLVFGTARLGEIFMFSVVATAVALVVYLRVFRSDQQRVAPAKAEPGGTEKLVTPALWWALCVGAGVSLVYGHWTNTLPLAIKDVRLLGFEVFPILILLNGLLTLSMQPLYRKLCARVDLAHLPAAGAACFAVAFAILALNPTHVVHLLGFMVMLAAGECLLFPSITSVICESAPVDRRSTWLALYGTTRAIGGVSISIGGVLLQHHPQWVFFSFLVLASLPLMLASLGLRRALIRRTHQKPSTPAMEPAA